MFRPAALVPVCLSIGLLSAQHSPVDGPVEGFTFDPPTRSFRTISGALGAASLGPALLSEFEFGSVAPLQNYAIAYAAGQCVLVSGLGSEQASTQIIVDSCTRPEGVIWSGDGAVAVLFSRTENLIQIVTGLPGQPNAGAAVSTGPLGSSLSAVCTDQHGTRTFIGVTGDSAGVYEVQSDLSLAPVLSLGEPNALAISDERQTLYALDAIGSQLYEVNLGDLSSQSWTVSELENPVAVIPVRDALQRQVLYVAGRADQLLVAYDASNHELLASVPLDFSPDVVERLGRHSFVLRKRANDGDPLWSFSDANEPAVYFVPASPLSNPGETQ